MSEKSKDKKVKPVEDVTVYATDKLAGLFAVGAPIVAHAAVAEKLVEDGKATEKEPKVKGGKEDA